MTIIIPRGILSRYSRSFRQLIDPHHNRGIRIAMMDEIHPSTFYLPWWQYVLHVPCAWPLGLDGCKVSENYSSHARMPSKLPAGWQTGWYWSCWNYANVVLEQGDHLKVEFMGNLIWILFMTFDENDVSPCSVHATGNYFHGMGCRLKSLQYHPITHLNNI